MTASRYVRTFAKGEDKHSPTMAANAALCHYGQYIGKTVDVQFDLMTGFITYSSFSKMDCLFRF